jgi:hypothetical protein
MCQEISCGKARIFEIQSVASRDEERISERELPFFHDFTDSVAIQRNALLI